MVNEERRQTLSADSNLLLSAVRNVRAFLASTRRESVRIADSRSLLLWRLSERGGGEIGVITRPLSCFCLISRRSEWARDQGRSRERRQTAPLPHFSSRPCYSRYATKRTRSLISRDFPAEKKLTKWENKINIRYRNPGC